MKKARWVLLAALLCALLAQGARAGAAATLAAEIGYDGIITYTRTLPLTATVEAGASDIDGIIQVDLYRNGREYDRVEYPIVVAAGAQKRVVLPIKLEMAQDKFTIQIVQGGETICETEFSPARALNPNSILLGLLSSAPNALSYLNADPDELTTATTRGARWQALPLSAQTFPETAELLSAFDILVVDGFDARTLSEAQREALDAWLRAGGLLLLGGGARAATSYPFFEKYTGIGPGGLGRSTQVMQALSAYASAGGGAEALEVLINQPVANQAPVAFGDAPFLYKNAVDAGAVLTCAFELGAKPFSAWQSARAVLQGALETAAPEFFLAEGGRNSMDVYNARSLLTEIPVPNDGQGALGALGLLIAYLLLAGLGSYFLLKKLDKRGLMWLTVPALALVALVALRAMGGKLNLDRPVAATFSLILQDERGQSAVDAFAGATSRSADGMVISARDASALPGVEAGWYDWDGDGTGEKEIPTQLRYRLIQGAHSALGLPASAPWTVQSARIEGVEPPVGGLSGRVWMEEDGLHAQIDNGLGADLQDGLLLSTVGFVRIGDLGAGSTASAALLKPADDRAIDPNAEWGQAYQNGKMATLPGTGTMLRRDWYEVIYSATYGDKNQVAQGADRAERAFRRRALETFSYEFDGMDANSNAFYVVAFSNELARPQIEVDGEMVERAAHRAMLVAPLAFEAVGPTGVVYSPAGRLRPDLAQAAADDPRSAEYAPADKSTYDFSAPRLFRFDLSDLGDAVFEAVSISATGYEVTPAVYLYDCQSGAWVAQNAGLISFKGGEIDRFLGEDKAIYLRIDPPKSAGSERFYASVERPTIELMGRLK